MPPEPIIAKHDLTELAGLVRDVKVTVEEENKKVLVRVDELEKTHKTTGNLVLEIEKRVAKAEKLGAIGGGLAECAPLKAAIPKRHLAALNLLGRMPMKVEAAVRLCAMESWLKNSILICDPSRSRVHGQLFEEMDGIEKAFGFEPTRKAALEGGTDTEGGFLVPVPLEAELLRQIEDESVMRALCRVFPMSAPTHNFPDLATNIIVSVVDEEANIGASEPTFGQKLLKAFKYAVRAITSMELVEDSAIGIFAMLNLLMNEKYALKEDQQVLEGTGSGEPTGVVAAAGVNEVTNGTDGAIFSPAKALEQKWKGRTRGTRRGSVWICAPEIVQQIEGFRVDAIAGGDKEGSWLYQPSDGRGNIGGLGTLPSGMFHGFPIIEHSEIKVDRTVGSGTNCSNMYFGPFRRAVIIGDRLGINFGVSEHTQWATGQLDLRMIKRTAVLVAVPADLTKQTGLKIAA